MIKYKIDVLFELKKRGFTTNKIRNEHFFGESTMSNIRRGTPPRPDTLNTLCTLLQCQPGDILEWVPDSAPSDTNTP